RQITYDLKHHDGLLAHGVHIDEDALAMEAAELSNEDGARMLPVRYGRARLDQVRRRQDYVLDCLRQANVVIECCPTINRLITGLAEQHQAPLSRFLEAGMRVVIGSDDPGLLDTDLPREFIRARTESDLDDAQMTALNMAAWQARSEILSGRQATESA
ncbi:MAG: hypothetical protein ACYTF0_07620, partial [Planctomycetota bacterium]